MRSVLYSLALPAHCCCHSQKAAGSSLVLPPVPHHAFIPRPGSKYGDQFLDDRYLAAWPVLKRSRRWNNRARKCTPSGTRSGTLSRFLVCRVKNFDSSHGLQTKASR